MTDYLERALREGVDALLEAERRLSAALLPLRAEGESSESREGAAPGQARPVPADGEARDIPAGGAVRSVPTGREARDIPAAGQAMWELVWPAESVRRTARARQGREALPEAERNGGAFAFGETRAEAAPRPALLEQLERTERAVSAGLSAVGTGGRPGASEFPSAPAGLRAAAGAFRAAAEPPAAAGGSLGRRLDSQWTEEDLAAQVDRSFQRDARRYDNGFFLY